MPATIVQKRILIIDDVSSIRAFVKAVLKEEPLQLSEAGGGQQALEQLAVATVDLILCDVNMHGMDGPEFVARLRQTGDRTPVIMLTAEGDRDVIGKLIELGIQGYILKPFKPAVLLARVREVLCPAAQTSVGDGPTVEPRSDPGYG
ncbi:MAG: response regulator [Rhodocyclaceae bacterium]|nr:response regulator [Rhodocyclaceae bacterium]